MNELNFRHQIFISYAMEDKDFADPLVAFLEERGMLCWIAPRDEVPGARYGDIIDAAIECAKVVLVLFSENALESEWVNREVELAASLQKHVIPVRLDGAKLCGQMRILLNNLHWMDATSNRDSMFEGLSVAVLSHFDDATRRRVQNQGKRCVGNDVFVCASSKDDGIARTIVAKLEAEGIGCWLASRDENDFFRSLLRCSGFGFGCVGSAYTGHLAEVISSSRVFLLLISNASFQSIRIKWQIDMGRNFRRVLPVKLEDVRRNDLEFLSSPDLIDISLDVDRGIEAVVEQVVSRMKVSHDEA